MLFIQLYCADHPPAHYPPTAHPPPTTHHPPSTDPLSSASLGAGFYINNCICGENQWRGNTTWEQVIYEGTVNAIAAWGFDGVKIDSCSEFTNMTKWSQLFAATGRSMLLENCHNSDGQDPCPQAKVSAANLQNTETPHPADAPDGIGLPTLYTHARTHAHTPHAHYSSVCLDAMYVIPKLRCVLHQPTTHISVAIAAGVPWHRCLPVPPLAARP